MTSMVPCWQNPHPLPATQQTPRQATETLSAVACPVLTTIPSPSPIVCLQASVASHGGSSSEERGRVAISGKRAEQHAAAL